MPIIHSLLDNDLYKMTMQWAVMKLYPNTNVTYKFINRGGHLFCSKVIEEIEEAISALCEVELTEDEYRYVKAIPFLPPVYADFLKGYRFNRSEVKITTLHGFDLNIDISGPWYRTILWEVPIMAIVSEVYSRFYTLNNLTSAEVDKKVSYNTLEKIKISRKNRLKIADFGTRRRFSSDIHRFVTNLMHATGSLVGTSNVLIAKELGIKPIGTHAHEWFMFHGAKYGFTSANRMALERWSNVYHGDLGIALSDTYTSEIFFKQFNKYYSKLFDGVRHDSGDPIEFLYETIEHYKNMGIDPRTKTIIFSDGLDIDKACLINEECKGLIKCSFGIGTNLTNDVGTRPLNIVVKMDACTIDNSNSWRHTVKLSDVPGKHTGDKETIERCKQELRI